MTQTPSALVHLPSPSQYPAYSRAVAQIPLLSEKEERRLVKSWRENGSTDAAQELVVSNLHLVVKVVKNHEGYGLSSADLAQEGTVGLMKAVHKFDPQKGVRLGTYAWYWIEAEIKEFILKNWRLVSFGTSSLAKKIFFGYRKTVLALRGLGEERPRVSLENVASSLNISLDDAKMAQAYFMGQDVEMVFEDNEEKDFSGENSTPGYSLPSRLLENSHSTSSPEEVLSLVDDQRSRHNMRLAVDQLPSRIKSIIEGRFLLEKPKTLQQLSQEHGVSIERVRQLEKQGVELLKDALVSAS